MDSAVVVVSEAEAVVVAAGLVDSAAAALVAAELEEAGRLYKFLKGVRCGGPEETKSHG